MISKEFYQSREWKNLDSLIRANILLVNEGIMPGNDFGSSPKDVKDVIDILRKLKLTYTASFDKRWWHYRISKDSKVLSDFIYESQKSDPDVNAGRFYGYPSCCIEEFINRFDMILRGIKPPAVDLREEYARRNLEYPSELDYKTWVPCRFDCTKTLVLSRQYKAVLCEYDKETARAFWFVNNQKIR